MVAGPGSETAAAQGWSRGVLRASHAGRDQVISTLKAAFVQGRLTKDELGERAGQVYASRTYAELAEVTAARVIAATVWLVRRRAARCVPPCGRCGVTAPARMLRAGGCRYVVSPSCDCPGSNGRMNVRW